MSTKAEHATKLHENGCNCAQAVACSFCQEFGIDENEMFRIAEGFGLGMSVMEMCGALSGMAMIIGLSNSRGNTDEGKHLQAGKGSGTEIQRKKRFLYLP